MRTRRRRRRASRAETPAHVLRAPHRHTARPAAAEPGCCRVCRQPVAIGKNGRARSWHDGRAIAGDEHEPNCLHAHKMRFRPNYAKKHIAKRDGARCATCTVARGRSYIWLHLDHIIPLVDGGSPEPDNMQLLCPTCHKSKTAIEATERAARRKEARHG